MDEPLRFAVVDVETNGRRPRRHRVVQLAVVRVLADGAVLDRWSTLVAPLGRRPGPTDVHRITRRSLRGAPRFAEVAPELLARLDGAVFTAHNAAFDWAFVVTELHRCGLRPPGAPVLCTLRLSRTTDPDRLLSHRLPDVCDRHGVVLGAHHDALADAEATAALLPHLLAATGVVPPSPARWATSQRPVGPMGRAVRWVGARVGHRPPHVTIIPGHRPVVPSPGSVPVADGVAAGYTAPMKPDAST